MLRTGSIKPIVLVESCLPQIKAHDSSLNTYITVWAGQARYRADQNWQPKSPRKRFRSLALSGPRSGLKGSGFVHIIVAELPLPNSLSSLTVAFAYLACLTRNTVID